MSSEYTSSDKSKSSPFNFIDLFCTLLENLSNKNKICNMGQIFSEIQREMCRNKKLKISRSTIKLGLFKLLKMIYKTIVNKVQVQLLKQKQGKINLTDQVVQNIINALISYGRVKNTTILRNICQQLKDIKKTETKVGVDDYFKIYQQINTQILSKWINNETCNQLAKQSYMSRFQRQKQQIKKQKQVVQKKKSFAEQQYQDRKNALIAFESSQKNAAKKEIKLADILQKRFNDYQQKRTSKQQNENSQILKKQLKLQYYRNNNQGSFQEKQQLQLSKNNFHKKQQKVQQSAPIDCAKNKQQQSIQKIKRQLKYKSAQSQPINNFKFDFHKQYYQSTILYPKPETKSVFGQQIIKPLYPRVTGICLPLDYQYNPNIPPKNNLYIPSQNQMKNQIYQFYSSVLPEQTIQKSQIQYFYSLQTVDWLKIQQNEIRFQKQLSLATQQDQKAFGQKYKTKIFFQNDNQWTQQLSKSLGRIYLQNQSMGFVRQAFYDGSLKFQNYFNQNKLNEFDIQFRCLIKRLMIILNKTLYQLRNNVLESRSYNNVNMPHFYKTYLILKRMIPLPKYQDQIIQIDGKNQGKYNYNNTYSSKQQQQYNRVIVANAISMRSQKIQNLTQISRMNIPSFPLLVQAKALQLRLHLISYYVTKQNQMGTVQKIGYCLQKLRTS